MGTSDWVKDLRALAVARKNSGQSWISEFQQVRAAGRAEHAEASRAVSRLLFVDDCTMFLWFAEHGVHSPVVRMSDLGIVDRLATNAEEITTRLEAAEVSERANILAEYGLQSSATISQRKLDSIRAASDEIGSNLVADVWYCSGIEVRQKFTADAADALQRFLAACR